jgi:hypothetical protein
MIFLIEYDRPLGRLVTFRSFEDADLTLAQNARLDIELALNREGVDREVVILQAPNEEALHQTHSRYFESIDVLLAQLKLPA